MSDAANWNITPAELDECIDRVTLVDCREPEEFAENRLPGGKLIPLGELQQRAPDELDRGADIVIYCAHGMRSLQGLMALRMLGFEKTRSLEGGICAMEEQFPARVKTGPA